MCKCATVNVDHRALDCVPLMSSLGELSYLCMTVKVVLFLVPGGGELPFFCMSFNTVLVREMSNTVMGLLSNGGGRCEALSASRSAPSALQLAFVAAFALVIKKGWCELNVGSNNGQISCKCATHTFCANL